MPLHAPWKFSQIFGDTEPFVEVDNEDIVSSVEFDETGNFLAVGDRGGRVVVFEKEGKEFNFYCEFQAYESGFDVLKSVEIEIPIISIQWCKQTNDAQFFLTTNEKTIKYWKLQEKKIEKISTNKSLGGLCFPTIKSIETTTSVTLKNTFANAHRYNVNSISLCTDGETFISADDLNINLWNIENSTETFNIVDIKPEDMADLQEVITSASFHPQQCNLFMYGSSLGSIKLNDLRQNALCDNHAKYFKASNEAENSFFTEVVSSISDCKFSSNGRYIVSRDYMTLNIWDINMEGQPVKSIQVHEHLREKLCDLYEYDFIFDKFECDVSADGSTVVTGSYDNIFYSYDWKNDVVSTFEADKIDAASKIKTRNFANRNEGINEERMNFNSKAVCMAYEPKYDTIAVGSMNNLLLYRRKTLEATHSV